MISSYKPANAVLQWDEQGLPYSPIYGDVYYSRADALGESSHVFIAGNYLEARFAALETEDFTIGELGFGAGLNFLNACRYWCQQAPPEAHLNYVSCELHPLTRPDLQRLLNNFPELKLYSSALLQQYPDHVSGTHQLQLSFGSHRVSLTLLYGDALQMYRDCAKQRQYHVDAWFLDGFAPKSNPDMWQATLLQQLAILSHSTTTLSSYSVASSFRTQLEQAGFNWEKLAGFAGKKHMLSAQLSKAISSAPPTPTASKARTVCIVGAGLAGCSTAFELANRGWNVILVEKEAGIAAQASGNPQGILHFKPATADSADNRFNLHAFLYAARYYQQLDLPENIWSACGMMQLANNDKMHKRFEKLAASALYDEQLFRVLDAEAASELLQIPVTRTALHFPASGWLSPPALCRFYSSHPNIHLMCGQEVGMIDQAASGWEIQMHSEHGEQFLHAAHLVLCNSADVHRFQLTRHIPVISNRGQVDVYRAQQDSDLNMVVCGRGYIIPGSEGQQCIGGSFFIEGVSDVMLNENQQWHLQQMAEINAQLSASLQQREPLQRRVSNRCALPDRMPVVGAVDTEHLPGLWINIGHGSNGLARTPVCAALISSQMNTTPAPLCPATAAVVSPRRYCS